MSTRKSTQRYRLTLTHTHTRRFINLFLLAERVKKSAEETLTRCVRLPLLWPVGARASVYSSTRETSAGERNGNGQSELDREQSFVALDTRPARSHRQ